MAKNTVKEHEVVIKVLANSQLTKEMVDWLIAYGKNLNDNIKYHDPLLVQCVKELQPNEFRVATIKGNKYKVIDFLNDSILFTPEDLVQINKVWTVIEEDVPVEEKPEAEEPKQEEVKPKKATPKKTTAKKASTTTKKKTE